MTGNTLCGCVVFDGLFTAKPLMPSSPWLILNEMRISQISILSLLTFALSDARYYTDLIEEPDVVLILDVISAMFCSLSNSWALAQV
jgi:hypothetical protein